MSRIWPFSTEKRGAWAQICAHEGLWDFSRGRGTFKNGSGDNQFNVDLNGADITGAKILQGNMEECSVPQQNGCCGGRGAKTSGRRDNSSKGLIV